ncbi:MAG: DNA double-strand break repair protein Mre11 [Halanaeroarchaeum sp.]
MTRVIHTGDTHVGYRQYHSPVRRQDYLNAFRQVVDDAVEDGVDAVVHAGDLFDDRRPALPDLLETIDILRTLDAAGIPFLAIVGNHEDARRGQWLDLFETLDLAHHLDDSGLAVGDTTFYGMDFVPQSQRDRLDYHFGEPTTDHAALVTHGLFEPFPHGDWDLEAVLDRATVAFDAVLLGDDHTPRQRRVDGTWATYCGSTERTSAAERDPRGYNVITFDDGVSIARRGVDTRDFVFIDVTLGSDEGSSLIRERIREADVQDAVVVVTVEGDGEDITPADVESFGEERGALITRVNDRREFEDDESIDVSFADPDEAVADRVREMGLSDAARTIDETVRSADVVDSNVRERVRTRVRELLEEPERFEPVPTAEQASGTDADDPTSESADGSDTAEGGRAKESSADTSGDVQNDTDPAGRSTREQNSPDDSGGSQTTTMEDFL